MRLFVCNINPVLQEADVKALFQAYGDVDYFRLEFDKETYRSKGYAYVDMSPPEAKRAQSELNGIKLKGCELIVKPARRGDA